MRTNKTILITGATGGIGKALSNYLSKKSYNLILCARNTQNLIQLKNELSVHQNEIKTFCFDFSEPSSFSSVLDVFEALDGLVIMPPQPQATTDCLPATKTWEKVFKESFIGPVTFIKHCIPYLEKSHRSKVVIVSGVSSAQVIPHYATSNVIRTAWLAQAKTLAFAYGEKNIHFNTLSLGGVMTDGYKERLKDRAQKTGVNFDDFLKKDTENIPLRKYATPQEIASAIESLLSEASDHMTGVNILCDGGFTRAY